MDYFECSQKIRHEIESSPHIMEAIRDHITYRRRAEFIGSGDSNIHYRIGQIDSGVWLATRESQGQKKLKTHNSVSFISRTLDEEITVLEGFCQRAEVHAASEEYIVTSFCIGAAYLTDRGLRGFILLEDLTQGDSVGFYAIQDKGIIKGESRKIFFDLSLDNPCCYDAVIEDEFVKEIVYFKPENMIVFQ